MTTDYGSALAKAEQDATIVRAQMTLTRLGESWAKDTKRGLRFIKGLTTWLASYTNENTRRVNSYSILEFFEWFEANRTVDGRRGQIPLPWQVTREDANAYAQYLRTRKYGLEEERLRKDPTKKLELLVYGYVKGHPGARYGEIRKRLLSEPSVPRSYKGYDAILEIEKEDPLAFDRLLACMVEAKQLTRKPTIEELRRNPPNADEDWARVGLDFRAPPDIFQYAIDAHTDGTAEERASTVLRRVATLSALWRHYIERGENTQASQDELLKYNIWADLVKHEGRVAPLQQRVHRLEKTPSLDHWRALVATTRGGAIEDVRDAAILAMMFWMGLRVTEMVRLRRKDRVVIDNVPYLRLLRKRQKAQLLAAPQPVLMALDTLDRKISELASDAEARQVSLARKTGLSDAMPVPRWRRLLDSPDAPLLPAVSRWGCNATQSEGGQDAPITRQAVTMMLRRRGHAAGIPEEEWDKLHPHGFRRLGARTAYEAGTPLTTIQTALGHDNIATTGRYIEDRDQERVALFPQQMFPDERARPAPVEAAPIEGAYAPPPSRREQREAARKREKPVIEATLTTVVEEAEQPEPESEPFLEEALEESVTEEPSAVIMGSGSAAAVFPPSRQPQTPAYRAAEMAPAPTDDEKLVGLSACAPLERAGEGSPDYAYDPECWGEKYRNACGQAASIRIVGEQDRPRAGDAASRVWLGRGSRLLWWSGTGDNLVPRMPVMSEDQLRGGGNIGLPYTAGQPIVKVLADLWQRWTFIGREGESHPNPTAATALAMWVAEAITVTDSVQFQMIGSPKRPRWIRYDDDAPLVDEPDEIFKTFSGYRRHREDKVCEWFEQNAYAYRVSRGDPSEKKGRERKLDDRPASTKDSDAADKRKFYIPSWYMSDDPVKSLPKKERTQLIDMLAALTGSARTDETPRFKSKLNGKEFSFADLFLTLESMCKYDSILSELATSRAGKDKERVDRLHQDIALATEAVEENLDAFGWTPQGTYYDAKLKREIPRGYRRLVKERIIKRKSPKEEGKEEVSRGQNDKFYLGILAEIFGDEIKDDVGLQILAKCPNGDFPLSGYEQMFTVDLDQGTIVHSDQLRHLHAKVFGTHSECVARRIARSLWELRKANARIVQTGRGSELVQYVAAMAEYRVPCPASLERELRDRTSRVVEEGDRVSEARADSEYMAPFSQAEYNAYRELLESLDEADSDEERADIVSEIKDYLAERLLYVDDEGELRRLRDPFRRIFFDRLSASSSLGGRREEGEGGDVSAVIGTSTERVAQATERRGSEEEAGGGTKFEPNRYMPNAAVLRVMPNPIDLLFAAAM